MNNPSDRIAYVVTGPTSGMGRSIARTLATPGATVFLVARDRVKLDALVAEIEKTGRHAIAVVADFTNLESVTRAGATIVERVTRDGLSLRGLVNNAGTQQRKPTKTAQGFDVTFTVNHLAAFALTEAVLPAMAKGSTVLFIGSGTENPDEKGATDFGFRGARFLSVEQSAAGVFAPGGSDQPGLDNYATSKLCNILSARGLARETDAVRFFALDPGLVPGTGLAAGEISNPMIIFAWHYVLPVLARFKKGWSTPARVGRVASKILKDASGSPPSGAYFDHGGTPQSGSAAAQDDALAARVLAETRAFLKHAP